MPQQQRLESTRERGFTFAPPASAYRRFSLKLTSLSLITLHLYTVTLIIHPLFFNQYKKKQLFKKNFVLLNKLSIKRRAPLVLFFSSMEVLCDAEGGWLFQQL